MKRRDELFVERADRVVTEYLVLREALAQAHQETPAGAAAGTSLQDLDTVAAILLPATQKGLPDD